MCMAPTLEDPAEFQAWIQSNVEPARGRDMVVELQNGTYDFQGWMEPMQVKLTGLAATHNEPLASHVWRIIPRFMLSQMGFEDAIVDVQNDLWKDIGPSDHDAILLIKTYMHSNTYSQNPLLLLPESLSQKLTKDGRVLE